MRTISPLFRDALNVSHTKSTRIVCTTPDGNETTLRFGSGGVSSSGDSGVRYTARLEVLPESGVDLYGIVSTPGALFDIDHGIEFGGDATELVDYGVYEAASGGINIIDGAISLSLVDQWQRVERSRFSSPYTPGADEFPVPTMSRGAWIERVLTDQYDGGIPNAVVDIRDGGGDWTPALDKVWDRDRTQFINDLANDGGLDVYFAR